MSIIPLINSLFVLALLFCFFKGGTPAGSLKTRDGEPLVSQGVSPLLSGAGYDTTLQILYLGSGGHLIRRGRDAIMTAPFFSNPGLFSVAFHLPVRTDTATVDRCLPPLDGVEAILTGHAHYDHAMDLPYIMRKYAPDSVSVYSSSTLTNILAASAPASRLITLDDVAADSLQTGRWTCVNDGRIRFMALASGHAPNIRCGFSYTIATGSVTDRQDKLPRTAHGWKLGQAFAYMIDIMDHQDTSQVTYRIYYQDAAHPPEDFHRLNDGIPVDVAIVCVASFDNVEDYPERVISVISPRHLLLGHWEDFFRPYTQDLTTLRAVPLTDPEEFVRHLPPRDPPEFDWQMPAPGAWLRYGK